MDAEDGNEVVLPRWVRAVVLAAAFGVFGVVVLRHVLFGTESQVSTGESDEQRKKGENVNKCRTKVGRVAKAAQDAREPVSDLLRNLGSVFVVVGSGKRTPLVEFCPSLKGESSHEVNELVIERIRKAMKSSMEDAWKSVHEGENITLPSGTHDIVIEMLTVTPSVDCLLDAKLLPSMFQPLYTLVVGPNCVRCVVDGFVGFPLLGPADPNKKYTPTRIRIICEDIVRTCVEKVETIEMRHCQVKTSATSSESIANDHFKVLSSLSSQSASEEAWNEYLVM